jgi:hypothetical protein
LTTFGYFSGFILSEAPNLGFDELIWAAMLWFCTIVDVVNEGMNT